MPTCIRPAAGADEAALTSLVAAAGLPLDGLDAAEARLVAEQDGRLVGVAALELHRDARGTAYLLRSVAVRADLRGVGLGGALTRAALQLVDGDPAPVGLLTETASDWFPRFGFVEVPRSGLPTALAGSRELTGACPVSARAFLRDPCC